MDKTTNASMQDRPKGNGPQGSAAWVGQFEGQLLVCGLLAKALYGGPDRDWLDGLIANRVFDSIPFRSNVPEIAEAHQLLQAWGERHRPTLNDETIDALHDDHTRLFVGPGKLLAAPWESVYINKDRAVFQLESVAVKKWYERFDLALASEYNEPADHVGLEFGFLAHLADLTVAASGAHDGEEVKRLIAAQRGFVAQHMARWIARWAEDVTRHARTTWYVAMAALARAAVAEAESFFVVSVPRVPKSGPFRIVPA